MNNKGKEIAKNNTKHQQLNNVKECARQINHYVPSSKRERMRARERTTWLIKVTHKCRKSVFFLMKLHQEKQSNANKYKRNRYARRENKRRGLCWVQYTKRRLLSIDHFICVPNFKNTYSIGTESNYHLDSLWSVTIFSSKLRVKIYKSCAELIRWIHLTFLTIPMIVLGNWVSKLKRKNAKIIKLYLQRNVEKM
jgi:hypothetical protein